jgi:hypothetical protein
VARVVESGDLRSILLARVSEKATVLAARAPAVAHDPAGDAVADLERRIALGGPKLAALRFRLRLAHALCDQATK